MAHLIDKDALVAEIERLYKKHSGKYGCDEAGLCLNALNAFIDTLEVKEVDLEHLEQEVKDFCYKFDDRKDKWYDMTPHDKNIMVNPTWSNFAMQLAKHFFELGLRASNPLTWEDVRDIMELYDEVTSMDYCNDIYEEVLKRFKEKRINYGTTRSDRPCKE